jgi:hypothetical protein
MIKLTITDTEVRLENRRSGRIHVIETAQEPEVFGHPRHLMRNAYLAIPLLNRGLRAVHGRSLWPLRVVATISRSAEGGLADVDFAVLRFLLRNAGAYSVKFTNEDHGSAAFWRD